MAFDEIEVIKPSGPKHAAVIVPDDGILVRPAQLTRKDKTVIRFIRVRIGAKLARGISLTQPDHNLKLSFGTGDDTGKLMVATDNAGGKFRAARDKKHGFYTFVINAATADGLFALTFPAFSLSDLSFSPGSSSSPPRFIFTASPEMLAVAED